MKKFLLSMAAGAIALTASAVPAFATTETGKTNIGYVDAGVVNPDNPTNPDWSVSIPKDFMFKNDDTGGLTHIMDVELIDVRDGGLATDQKVLVQVESENGYLLKNDTATKQTLKYTLNYTDSAGTDVSMNAAANVKKEVGYLAQDNKKIAGKAELDKPQLSELGIKGTYTDVLTYTVNSAEAK